MLRLLKDGRGVSDETLETVIREYGRIFKCKGFEKNRLHKVVRQRAVKAKVLLAKRILRRFE